MSLIYYFLLFFCRIFRYYCLKFGQDRRRKNNVKPMPFRATTLQWKSNKYYIFWVCVSKLSHPACTAHASYYIVTSGLPDSIVFSILSHKRHDFLKKKIIEYEICVLILSTKMYERLLITKRIEADMITNEHWSPCKVRLILVKF